MIEEGIQSRRVRSCQATMSLERKEDESSHDDDPCLSDNKVKDEIAPFLFPSTTSIHSINF